VPLWDEKKHFNSTKKPLPTTTDFTATAMRCLLSSQSCIESSHQYLHDQASAWEGTYVIGKLEGMKEGIEIGVEQGIGIGIEQGIEQGMKQKELEIAKKSLQKGLDTQTIMMITTLSEEEIEGR
jgi:predicted transposase YdaD